MRNPFDVDLVDAALVTLPGPWRRVEFHARLPSTNDEIKRHRGTPGWTPSADPAAGDGPTVPGCLWRVVLTDHQTGGRGRLGRGWQVPDRAAISMSVTVPVTGPRDLPWVPLLAGVALSRAVGTVTAAAGTPLTPRLKWPNDVLLDDGGERKLSGILCGLVGTGPSARVVIGTGVNVDQTRAELPVATATSLALAGAAVRREHLVIAYLGELGRLFTPEATGEREAGTAAYRQLCATLGRRVRVHLSDGRSVDGTAVGIGAGAELLVRTPGGQRAFAAGDVEHVRRPDGGLA
ncbi:biotin--[acetyl-CoA-carboxylase] ligase [Intrasporangium sp.]|uniref:biotin--[acetyl-CoA-carboxylase] ligase n=1 Tax=Intrasporangium sp. TaxID=1925024 RepID=UPI003221C027